MKAAPFEYVAPTSLDDALAELARREESARPLAGGQSLVPLLAMRLARPTCLVDLNRTHGLSGVERAEDGLRVGAMTRLAELERAAWLPDAHPLLSACLPEIGHFQIRSRSTVGGCLAHCDPAAELPALLVLLEGKVWAASVGGKREIEAGQLIAGPFTSTLEPSELLVEAFFPFQAGSGWGFAEVARRAGDYALIAAAAYLPAAGRPRLVVFGGGGMAQRLLETEAPAAQGADRAEIAAAASREIDAVTDLHASAEYRRVVGGRLVGRVLEQARARQLPGAAAC